MAEIPAKPVLCYQQVYGNSYDCREGAFDVQNALIIPHAKLLRKLGSLTGGVSCEK
jgi:hypothetical protein